MRIRVAALAPLATPLTPPLVGRWRARAGILLELTDERGGVGRGEASPLPGTSPDDLDACRAALAALPPLALDLAGPLLPQIAAAGLRVPAHLPAARFALESALLDLAGRRLGAPAHALLSGGAARAVPLCAAAAGVDPVGAARAARARGVGVVKRKIGPRDDGIVARLRDALPDVALRLDANRSLPDDEAAARLAALGPVELVEEPCRDLGRVAGGATPIAADESLLHGWPRVPVAAVVLKPALLGGLLRCLELARHARARGVDVIVTHLWDGPVGLAAAAALALALCPARACGLDRHPALALGPPARLPFLADAAVVPGEWAGLGVLA